MIINSLLQTDKYKWSMLNYYINRHPNATTKWSFKDRTKKIKATDEFLDDLNKEIQRLGQLKFQEDEIQYLLKLDDGIFNNAAFENMLRNWKLPVEMLDIYSVNDELKIETLSSENMPIIGTMLEIYILEIVNELWCKYDKSAIYEDKVLQECKAEYIAKLYAETNLPFCEFGSRRRFSAFFQEAVIANLIKYPNFKGTSNTYYAKKYNLPCIGTFAHELVCLGQAIEGIPVEDSQKYIFSEWLDFYQGKLAICLTDNLGNAKFEKDFTYSMAAQFKGFRHDSGDPIEWIDMVIKILKKYEIDPRTKSYLFSDGLNNETACEIYKKIVNKHGHEIASRVMICWGTSLTNPWNPTNIVFKAIEFNKKPVCKLSSTPGKIMSKDEEYIKFLTYAIENR